MPADPDFEADLARYPPRPFLKEQSIWAIYVYRYGRRALNRKPGAIRSARLKLYWTMFRLVETITGISLPLEAKIGPGLRIYHFGNIFVHSGAIIGRNCTLRQGVTIGNRVPDGPTPSLKMTWNSAPTLRYWGVSVSPVGAKIGAMAVVLQDVPSEATATGVAAQIKYSGRSEGR